MISPFSLIIFGSELDVDVLVALVSLQKLKRNREETAIIPTLNPELADSHSV